MSTKAAAFLHPGVSLQAVRPFQEACPEAVIVTEHCLETLSAALIFGGDGTMHRHLPQLHERKIPSLIVPAGSGNDFAKSLGITNKKIALEAWRRFCAKGDNVREIDLGVIRPVGQTSAKQDKAGWDQVTPEQASPGEASSEVHSRKRDGSETLFCCVAGIGMDAEANRIANAMPDWLKGSGGYVLAALRAMLRFQPTEFRVKTDASLPTSREIAKPGMFVAIGNAGRYGGGAKVAPTAQLDDGLLEVCFVGKMNRIKVAVCFPTIFLGRHLGIREVEYFQAHTIRVETERPLALYADGEPVCQTPVEIGLIPKALKVIVPG
jgi:diacylglycerol kinase (ATP)